VIDPVAPAAIDPVALAEAQALAPRMPFSASSSRI
jgi:hypothetical protein